MLKGHLRHNAASDPGVDPSDIAESGERVVFSMKLAWRRLFAFRAGKDSALATEQFQDTADIQAVEVRPQLVQLAKTLDQATKRTDPDFVRLSSDLKALYACAAELSRSTTSRVSSVRDALQQNTLLGDNGLAAHALNDLQSGLGIVERSVASLTQVSDSLRRLKDHGQRMERLALLLRSTASSFAVESARVAEHLQAFGAFTEEVRALADKIYNLGRAISEESSAIFRNLSGLAAAMHRDLVELGRLSERSRGTLRSSSGEVEHLIGTAWKNLEAAQSRTEAISKFANDAVYQLQFGDIVRQKLEHVVTSLNEAAGSLLNGTPSDFSKAERTLEIQQLQVQAVNQEMQQAKQQLAAAFDGLGRETQQLVEGVKSISSSSASSSGQKDLFRSLTDGLTQLGDWQARGTALCTQAQSMSKQAVDSLTKLSDYLGLVQEINREMHLQALNAIIKAAILGDNGRTLAVLSTHVHTIFERSNELVQSTVQILEEVRTLASQAAQSTTSSEGDRGAALRAGVRSILDVHEQFVEAGRSAGVLASKQGEQLEVSRSRLQFLEEFSQRLRSFEADIRQSREVLRPWRNQAAVSDGVGQVMDQRYTMESERLIHRQLEAGVVPALATACDPSAPDVEFFDAPTTDPARQGQASQQTVPAGSTPSSAAAGPAGSSGDNVEFF